MNDGLEAGGDRDGGGGGGRFAAGAGGGGGFPRSLQQSLLPSSAAEVRASAEQENILKILGDIQNNLPVKRDRSQEDAKDKFLNKIMSSLPAPKKDFVSRFIKAARNPIEQTVGIFYECIAELVRGVGGADVDAAAVKYGVGPDRKLAFGTTIDSVVKLGLGSCISVPGHYGQLVYEVQWGSEAERLFGDVSVCLGSLVFARDHILYMIESGIMVCSFGFANLASLQQLFKTAYESLSQETIINALEGLNMTNAEAVLMWENIKSFSPGQIRYLLITLYLVAVRKWRSIGNPQADAAAQAAAAQAAAAAAAVPGAAPAQQSLIISLINDVWLLFFNNVLNPTMDVVREIFTLNFTVRPPGEGSLDFLVASTGALFQRGYDALISRSHQLSSPENRNSVLLKVASLSLKIPICDQASPEEKKTLVWKLVNDVKEYLFTQLCEEPNPPQEIETLRRLLVTSLDQKPDARMRRDSLLTYEEAQEFFMCFPLFMSNVDTTTLVRVYNEDMASWDSTGDGSLQTQPAGLDSMTKNLVGLREIPRCVVEPNFFVRVSQKNAECSDSLFARIAVAVGFDEPGVAVHPSLVDGKFQPFFAKTIFDRVVKVKAELTKWNEDHPDGPEVDIAEVDKSLMRIVHFFITRFLELISIEQSAPPKSIKEAIKEEWDNLSTKMLGVVQVVTANSAQFVKSIVAEGMSMGFMGCLQEFMSGATATTTNVTNVRQLSLLVESSCEAIADPASPASPASPAEPAPTAAAPQAVVEVPRRTNSAPANLSSRRVRVRKISPPPSSSASAQPAGGLSFRVFKPNDGAAADGMGGAAADGMGGAGHGGSKSRKNTKRTRRHSKGRKSSKAAKKTKQRRSSRHRRSSRKGRK